MISSKESIIAYYEEVKDDYPDITFEQFRKCCQYPLKHYKDSIREDRLPDVRFKGLGVFHAYKSKLIHEINGLYLNYLRGKIPEERYISRRKVLENKLGFKYGYTERVRKQAEIIMEQQKQD